MNDDAAPQVGARASEAMGLFIEAVDQIPSTAWDQPSNLEGWSIRDLVAHTTGTAAKAVEASGGGIVAGPYNDAHERRAVVYDNKGNGVVFYKPLGR